MYKILIVFENNLDIMNNGEINLLKILLKNLPINVEISITNIGATAFEADNVKIMCIKEKNRISLLRKMFLSLTFNGCKKNKELINILLNELNLEEYNHIIFVSAIVNRYYKMCNKKNNRISLIMTDLPSIAFDIYIINSNKILNKIYYMKEFLWSKYYQRQVVKRYENIILVNKKETEYANKKYSTNNFITVPLVFEYPPDNKICNNKKDSKRYIDLVFLGNMSFRPNIDGITYFYNEIFLNLPEKYRLNIIGKGGNSFFVDDERVISYGFVSDYGKIMENMQIGICFMINGGGMKNKVFDYMKYGIPCIVNGYVSKNNTVDSEYIYYADCTEDFLDVVENKLNSNPERIRDSIKEYEAKNVSNKFWKIFL